MLKNKMEEFEIQKHELVPQHKVLKEDEAKKVLEKFNVNVNQLPKITRKDPALKGLDAKENDIIQITRNSDTAGKFTFYRVVV